MASSASPSNVTNGPVLGLVNERVHALIQEHKRILQMEKSIPEGTPPNKEQEEVLRSKPSILACIRELDDLRPKLSSALQEELSLAAWHLSCDNDVPSAPNKGDANNSAGANDGTVGGTSFIHTSTEGQGVDKLLGYDYDVFLSFRGEDVRSGFVDFLYDRLVEMGIHTFKDDESLRVGEKFEPKLYQAINRSKISIPVFSRNYASSVWCLNELVHMVNMGKKIKPIFYDVSAGDVRHQKGDYEKAFDMHKGKKRHAENTMQGWRNALKAVADLNGWNLHKLGEYRREGQFAKRVAHELFIELEKDRPMVSDSFVNVDNHVGAIMGMIKAQSSERRIIGIHGMGGVGKTTIAEMIYSELSKNFEYRCFLSNIRQMSERKEITRMQHQLITDMLNINLPDIKSINDGARIIEGMLKDKHVLLLLDDVDHKEHMDALVGKRDWFGSGSKLIITTRNEEILKIPQVDDYYKVDVMNPAQSLQLFSKHAFGSDYPSVEYTDQSIKAIDIAGGLPLSLEVIGSLLRHTKKEKWDATLKMLESVPHDKVQSKLKISYDALDFRQKHMFLDIACLFIGYNKDILVHFWKESIFFPEETMKVLEHMSLIKFDEKNQVLMHDHLRDLGREIIREKSDTRIEKHSRVWDPTEGFDLFRRHKEKKEVEALRLKWPQQHYCLTHEGFESLSNLRLLVVEQSTENFSISSSIQEYSNLLPQLRWLSWHKIPPTFEIRKFLMEDLVFLDLSESQITNDWNGWTHIKVMKKLKVLDLSYCDCLERTPIFFADSNLERLILRGCKSLIEIDKSICQLKRLVFLDLADCGKLEKLLPDELGEGLASLKYLSLRNCRSLKRLSQSIGNLKSLIELDVSKTTIKMLPHSIGNLGSLVKLDISGTSISELPYAIGNLRNLKLVKMMASAINQIPAALWTGGMLEEIEASGRDRTEHVSIVGNGISRSKSLRILRLSRAQVKALPALPGSLIKLELWNWNMDEYPDLSGLTNLKELELWVQAHDSDGREEYSIPRWFGRLSKLESLYLRCPRVTTSPADLSLPPQLKSLRLQCRNLRCLPKLPPSLSSLHLDVCNSLSSMEDLSHLKILSSLKIEWSYVAEIHGLGCLKKLRDLELLQLKHLERLPDLRNLNELRTLEVQYCGRLVEIQGELPRSLCRLRINFCPLLRRLPDLSSLMGKQVVAIDKCGNLDAEAILGYARKNPRDLLLEGIDQLTVLPNLRNLRDLDKLRQLRIENCGKVAEIGGEVPPFLEKLVIKSCESLRQLPDLSSLMGLREIFIGVCGNLVELQGELPQSLEKLEIDSCESLQRLPYLSSSMGLREIFIRKCGALVGIQGELPRSLEKLEIDTCKSLQELPYLSSLMQLRELCIVKCGKLAEFIGKLPQSLQTLKIDSCESLKQLPHLSVHNNQLKIQVFPQSLEILEIYSCPILETLPSLLSSTGLRVVVVSKCGALVEIQGELPHALEILEIDTCESLQKLPSMSSLKQLRELCIGKCGKLAGITGELPESLEKFHVYSCESLKQLPYRRSIPPESVESFPESLETLRIDSCESLQTLPYLSSSIGLRSIFISACGNLHQIQGELPQSLEELEISSCKSLHKLPDLSSLMGLRRIIIRECVSLDAIHGELPESLERLEISFCESLQELPSLLSLKGLQKVEIKHCGELDVKAIALLCSKKSVEFVGEENSRICGRRKQSRGGRRKQVRGVVQKISFAAVLIAAILAAVHIYNHKLFPCVENTTNCGRGHMCEAIYGFNLKRYK